MDSGNNGVGGVYAAEKIINRRSKLGKVEYRVKWKGWSTRYNTWEPEENILDTRLIVIYERSFSSPPSKRGPKRKERFTEPDPEPEPSSHTSSSEDDEEDEASPENTSAVAHDTGASTSAAAAAIAASAAADEEADDSDNDTLSRVAVASAVPQFAKAATHTAGATNSKSSHSRKDTGKDATSNTNTISKYFKKKQSSAAAQLLQREARDAPREKSRTPGRELNNGGVAPATTSVSGSSATKSASAIGNSSLSSSSPSSTLSASAINIKAIVPADLLDGDTSSSGSSSEDQPLSMTKTPPPPSTSATTVSASHVGASGSKSVNGAGTASSSHASSNVVTNASASTASVADTYAASTSSPSTSSSALLLQPAVGTKRKAEVLSKESGKIGVTIKTSSPEQPTAVKLPCTNISSSSSHLSTSHNKTAAAATSSATNRQASSAAAVTNSAHAPDTKPSHPQPATHTHAPLSPETPASRPESDTPTNNNSKSTPVAAPAAAAPAGAHNNKPAAAGQKRSNQSHLQHHHQQQQQQQQQQHGGHGNANVLKEIPHATATATGTVTMSLPVSPRTAPPRLWLPKVVARKAEEVFITDVTVNLETVTIRECKTEQGFFRHRPLKDPQDQQMTHKSVSS